MKITEWAVKMKGNWSS